QPGVVGGYLNRLLAPLGYRLGPDPASIDAAMMGGIIANNSSGMCCGVVHNAYHTLESLVFLLADGTLVDTARPDADDRLRGDRPRVLRRADRRGGGRGPARGRGRGGPGDHGRRLAAVAGRRSP